MSKKKRPDLSDSLSRRFLVSIDAPGNSISVMLFKSFFSFSSMGLNPKPVTHVSTKSGIADKTSNFTLNDFSICSNKKEKKNNNRSISRHIYITYENRSQNGTTTTSMILKGFMCIHVKQGI
jgi:hypothetical protein